MVKHMKSQPNCKNLKRISSNRSTRVWWQDPLLHFFAIGLLIFSIDNFVRGEPVSEKVIVIDKPLKDELTQQFQNQNRRQPTEKELDNMLETWIQTELLYRKGLSLGLDKNDPVIRDRLIQKTEFLFKNITEVKEPTDEQLRQWYKTKSSNYQKPPRYDFEHVLVKHEHANAEQQAEIILKQIYSGTRLQNFKERHHTFVGRNYFGLKVSFGDEFVDALDQITKDQWQILRSKKGWHVVRLRSIQQDPLPSFEKIKPLLLSDWRKQKQRQQAVNLIEELRATYVIVHESM